MEKYHCKGSRYKSTFSVYHPMFIRRYFPLYPQLQGLGRSQQKYTNLAKIIVFHQPSLPFCYLLGAPKLVFRRYHLLSSGHGGGGSKGLREAIWQACKPREDSVADVGPWSNHGYNHGKLGCLRNQSIQQKVVIPKKFRDPHICCTSFLEIAVMWKPNVA